MQHATCICCQSVRAPMQQRGLGPMLQHAVELLQHGVRCCNLLFWVPRGAEVARLRDSPCAVNEVIPAASAKEASPCMYHHRQRTHASSCGHPCGGTCALRERGGVRRATRCSTVQRVAAQYNVLQHSTTSCSTVQRVAAQYNILHHSTTCCSTVQQLRLQGQRGGA